MLPKKKFKFCALERNHSGRKKNDARDNENSKDADKENESRSAWLFICNHGLTSLITAEAD